MNSIGNTSADILAAKAKREQSFRKKDILIALSSGSGRLVCSMVYAVPEVSCEVYLLEMLSHKQKPYSINKSPIEYGSITNNPAMP